MMRSLFRNRLAPAENAAWEDGGQGMASDFDLNPWARPNDDSGKPLLHAAVLVPLIDRAQGVTVLFTRRTEHLSRHAGQVAFPGGRVEDGDLSPVDTALRETHEETGIAPSFVEVIGRLDSYETVTRFLITPVVGLVRPDFTLAPDPKEVAEVFEVPLAHLLDPKNHEQKDIVWKGHQRYYYEVNYDGHRIWGATAGMLMNLYRKISAP